MIDEIVEGILRVEKWNEQFRKPNPNGKYPSCKSVVGSSTCERCGDYAGYNRPCPAARPDQRWGPDYKGGLKWTI